MNIHKFRLTSESGSRLVIPLDDYWWQRFDERNGIREVRTFHLGDERPRVHALPVLVPFVNRYISDCIHSCFNRYNGNYQLPFHHDEESNSWMSILCLVEVSVLLSLGR